MKRFIKLDNTEVRNKICKTYGVTSASLSYALSFQRNSKTSIAMRAMALQNGGVYYEESNNKNIK